MVVLEDKRRKEKQMTETVITTQDWIKHLMDNGIIKICPRCCVNLTSTNKLSEYLRVWGYEEGAAQEKMNEFDSLGIKRGYSLYADCEEGELETSGTEFYVCVYCAENGVSIYEDSENWPIEGHF